MNNKMNLNKASDPDLWISCLDLARQLIAKDVDFCLDLKIGNQSFSLDTGQHSQIFQCFHTSGAARRPSSLLQRWHPPENQSGWPEFPYEQIWNSGGCKFLVPTKVVMSSVFLNASIFSSMNSEEAAHTSPVNLMTLVWSSISSISRHIELWFVENLTLDRQMGEASAANMFEGKWKNWLFCALANKM